jgi:iron(III) transport system permease protein
MAVIPRTNNADNSLRRVSRVGDQLVQWGIAIVVVGLVLFPTWPIVYQSFLSQPLYEIGQTLTLSNYPRVLTNPAIWRVIGNTVILMVGSTLLGSVVGIVCAVLLTRTDVPGRRMFAWLITIPYYVSALILAFTWSAIYGPQGFITVWVRNLGLPVWDLYSLGGMIVVSALYFMPFTYLYCSSSLQLADPQLENAARIGGARPLRTLLAITIPLIRPAMMYSFILTLVSGIELLSIPLVLGAQSRIDVLSTYLYRTAVISGTTDYGTLAVVAILVVGFVTVLVWLQNYFIQQERRFVSVGGKVARAQLLSLGRFRWPAAIGLGLFVLLVILIPLAGIVLRAFTSFLSPLVNPFTLLTLDNFSQAFEFQTYRLAIVNSLIVATVGGLAATIFMALCALLAYRSAFPFRAVVKYLALYPRAFPGTVIGLGFLWALLSFPAVGWLRNTLWILVIAYTMRYLPLGFSAISPSILQISDELDRAARVGGASWRDTIRHILFPLLRPVLISTYILLFVTFLKEYSVALFLFARGSQVIGTTMIEVWAQGETGAVAALAVVQMIIIGVVMSLSRLVPKVKLRE